MYQIQGLELAGYLYSLYISEKFHHIARKGKTLLTGIAVGILLSGSSIEAFTKELIVPTRLVTEGAVARINELSNIIFETK